MPRDMRRYVSTWATVRDCDDGNPRSKFLMPANTVGPRSVPVPVRSNQEGCIKLTVQIKYKNWLRQSVSLRSADYIYSRFFPHPPLFICDDDGESFSVSRSSPKTVLVSPLLERNPSFPSLVSDQSQNPPSQRLSRSPNLRSLALALVRSSASLYLRGFRS